MRATMWVLTRDNMDHVAEQTGYTVIELEKILDAYDKMGKNTVRIAKKPAAPPGFVFERF